MKEWHRAGVIPLASGRCNAQTLNSEGNVKLRRRSPCFAPIAVGKEKTSGGRVTAKIA